MSTLQAVTETGDRWDDPSEDLLFELLLDIDRGDEQFVVVHRTSDASQQTYAQVIVADTGDWIVEHRAGGPDRHFAATLPGLREAHDLLTRWAFELSGWQDDPAWRPLDFG